MKTNNNPRIIKKAILLFIIAGLVNILALVMNYEEDGRISYLMLATTVIFLFVLPFALGRRLRSS